MKLQEIVLEDAEKESKTIAYVKSMLEAYGAELVDAVSECSTALKELKTPMYRGDTESNDFAFRKAVTKKRTSQTGTNFLLNLLDSTILENSARRGYSTFATKTFSHSAIFGERFLIFPSNSVKQFISSEKDINSAESPIQAAFKNVIYLVSDLKFAPRRPPTKLQLTRIENLKAAPTTKDLSKEDQQLINKMASALEVFDEALSKIVKFHLDGEFDKIDFMNFMNYCKAIQSKLEAATKVLLAFNARTKRRDMSVLSSYSSVKAADLLDGNDRLIPFLDVIAAIVRDIDKMKAVLEGQHGLTKHSSLSTISKTAQEVWFEGPYMLIKLYPFVDYTVLRTQLLNLKPRQ